MKRAIGTAAVLLVLAGASAQAGPAKAYNIRMRRTDMPDTTDVQSILDSVIQAGMTDKEKAQAIWRVVFQYSHQDSPPQEQLAGCTHDVVKLMNVYGYRMCCCASACVETLAHAAGFSDTRTDAITGHNVSEVFYGGAWHMLDSSLICYYYNNSGIIASVAELCADPNGLIDQAHCPFLDTNDWFPAMTHNRDSALVEYGSGWNEAGDGVYNGYSAGHRNLLTLRENETLVRSCLNDGSQHHVNEDIAGPPGCIDKFAGVSSPEFLYMDDQIPDQNGTFYYVHPGYHGGIVGNGTLTYQPDLSGGGYRRGMESETNLACTADDGQTPAVHLASPGSGSLVIRMQSPYVFLGGSVDATFKRASAGDSVRVFISTNNMLDWQEIYSASATGAFSASIDTGPSVYRRYCYYLKFELSSSGAATDAGIDSLTISNLIQHAQRAMPFLVQGNNEITVDAGGAVSTIAIEPRVTTSAASPSFDKNETLTTMHATISGMNVSDGYLWDNWSGGGRVTFPVSAPGDIVAVRMGGTFRVRDAADTVTFQVSTTGPDSGYTDVHTVSGPDIKISDYATYTGIPGGTRDIWVRFATSVANTSGIMGHLCIYVDYTEPSATVLPFKIKHEWTEGGTPMSHTEEVTSIPHTYSINCASEPTMTALTTWVEPIQAADTEAPAVSVTACDLTGTVVDDNSTPTEVTVGGVNVTVSGTDWSRPDIAVSSGAPITITADDASGNTATMSVTPVY